jgi:hypothetical protein
LFLSSWNKIPVSQQTKDISQSIRDGTFLWITRSSVCYCFADPVHKVPQDSLPFQQKKNPTK